jgi:ATP-binding cassette subfamily B protein
VGYVPQDPILFHTTIKENLLWAFPDATDDELWHSLELANSADFVKALPLGINTFVGDRGVRLSGGQRQRIALARALVRNPDLLILDEATSALDSESERLIQKSIEKVSQDSTVLVIAHRLSTISKAEYVYILDHGSVIEEGSYEKLSKSKGSKFNKMISAGHPI